MGGRVVIMSRWHFFAAEKTVALVAFAGALGAVTWRWQRETALRHLRAERVGIDLPNAAYVASRLPEPPPPAKPWLKPSAQSAGAGWVLELFTPPEIYYHAAARAFAVVPPVDRGEPALAARSFGLELLAVKREPFRLQLVGYVGAPGDYVAAFVSEQTPETLLARAGKRFDQLGLALKSFEIRRVNLAPNASRPIYDVAAIATLFDERAGAEVTLDSRGPTLTDTPLAVLRRTVDANARPRVLRQGDTFEQDEATFRIEHIQLDPPEVVVARHAPGLPTPELRVLKPEAATRTAAKPKPIPVAADRPGLAHNAARP